MKQLLPSSGSPTSVSNLVSKMYTAHQLSFQVFMPTMDEMDRSCKFGPIQPSYFSLGSGEWLTEKLAEAGIDVPVQKVSGNCSATEKERAMESFRTG